MDICLSLMFVNWMNCCFHCWADTLSDIQATSAMPAKDTLHRTWTHAEVQSTSTLFLMVHAAVMPTRVLPAPQGNTMMPDLARLRAKPVRSTIHFSHGEDSPVTKHLAQ